MERIIDYEELPHSRGKSIYLRMETDPKLYIRLLSKGYKVIKNICDADETTIYVTGRRQDYQCKTHEEYSAKIKNGIHDSLKYNGITRPNTVKFSYEDLINYKYKLPFVFKNENQNGGREKFLINTEEDYENLISACDFLRERDFFLLLPVDINNPKCQIDYKDYLESNFYVQEYIKTPSEFNTTVRLLTSSSNDLLYAALKYKKPDSYIDDTTLLGYLLKKVYPLSTESIVSNTLSGGKNILIGEDSYPGFEKELLDIHNIDSNQFHNLVNITKVVHEKYKSELGILCGFDYIYDENKNQWFLLEYHSRPMVGDYSKRQGIAYNTEEDKMTADGRVRATALSLVLKKKSNLI